MIETSTKCNQYAARIPKGMVVGVVGNLSFEVQGWGGGGGGVLAQFGPIWKDREKGKGGCKHWTFFMDVIKLWSITTTVKTFIVSLVIFKK